MSESCIDTKMFDAMELTVIIVDDSSTNRVIYSTLAGRLQKDAQVVSFSNPVDALAWLNSNAADLIITDFKMPLMDGAEFTRRIRGRKVDYDIPVIVVTGYKDQAFRMQALDAGATDFLLSPIDHYEFAARSRNLLKLRFQQKLLKRQAEDLAKKLEQSEQAHQTLVRDSREALAQVIDTVPALISAVDRSGRCLFVNESLLQFARVAAGEREQVEILNLLGPVHAAMSISLNKLVFELGKPLDAREESVPGPDGTQRTLLTTRAPLRNALSEVVSVLTTSIDITDRKLAEERLYYLAHHDTLTELPNRTLLYERLNHCMEIGQRKKRLFALHFIDLDRFKAINDGFGHHFGDQLLIAVSERLSQAIRSTDTVARLGGDEFAIIQADITGPDDAAMLASKISLSFSEPFVLDGQNITVEASIGITIYPRDGGNADDLLRNADLAMYRAKASGRDAWRFFAADMGPPAREAIRTEADLRNGLARGEFVLHYQPQVNIATRRITGVEALVRWNRPNYGLVGPSAFIGLAEETGLILPISAWVLQEACQQAIRWQEEGLRKLRMAVNLSSVQLYRQDVFGLVTQTLAETGLSPELLDLELTESVLIDSAEGAVSTLQQLRNLGVHLSIDDFGTGYSSLSYVKNLPFSRLKIDQSFTRTLATDKNDMAIIRTILDFGRILHLGIVAEGVETQEQMSHLMAEGCEEAQGYYFSEPLTPSAFAALLRRDGVLPEVSAGA